MSKTISSNQIKRTVLVTGGAGFIGSHLIDSLLGQGNTVVALDNFNSFYDPKVKRRNIQEHLKNPAYHLFEGDIRDDGVLGEIFSTFAFDVVVHLAAMAGVRPSLQQPAYYMDVNVMGTQKLLEQVGRSNPSTRFVFGSSSSVYGERSGESFLETDRIDKPLSPYAASKAAGELICYSAHATTSLPVVCLRFFTVFGPRQRPDLAIHKFCRWLDEARPLELFGDGSSKRDYTFVADIVGGIEKAMSYDLDGFDIINLGRSEPVTLLEMVNSLENALGKKATLLFKSQQIGDMPYTHAGIEHARKVLDYNPSTSFDSGIEKFVSWFLKENSTYAQQRT